ncbi:MAG: tetratricopeptide repeat protein [Pirellulaceae bacterium]|nr:tetratricopeptide repeat protein [Pirellulaceae bacterium]
MSARTFVCSTPMRVAHLVLIHLGTFALLSVGGCGGGDSGEAQLVAELQARERARDSVRHQADGSSVDPVSLVERADQFIAAEDYNAAAKALKQALLADPNDYGVVFRLANVRASQRRHSEAVELLDSIPASDPVTGLPALGQAADWCIKLERYDDAERRYRNLISLAPKAVIAHRQLARLLNRQGRRHEATEHVRALCRLGDVQVDELQSLMVLSDSMYHQPIGSCGRARQLFERRKFREAVALLYPSVSSAEVPPAVLAFCGRVIAEAQDDDRYHDWIAKTDDQTKQFSEYWAALGAMELSIGNVKSGIRALAEALDRDPTDFLSVKRIYQALLTLDDQKNAAQWEQRFGLLKELMNANYAVTVSGAKDSQSIEKLAGLLRDADRDLEANLWKTVHCKAVGGGEDELKRLSVERQKLIDSANDFPSQSERLCGLSIDDYPLPIANYVDPEVSNRRLAVDDPAEVVEPVFKNIAGNIGLEHTYHVAEKPKQQQYAIHQTLGGGVAVLDYDRNGACDLYLAQGGVDGAKLTGQLTNQLLRNVDQLFHDNTSESETMESQYSLGVTAGDWNQDGFADLVIANIGADVLLINNGDGTFARQLLTEPKLHRVPSSVAIADVTGDALPDIYQVVYVDDETIYRIPELDTDGRVVQPVSPGDYDRGSDRLTVNDGRGGFINKTFNQSDDVSPGLGVVVTNFDDDPDKEVFVGNDLAANQLWKRDPETGHWGDVASVKGCAFSSTGLATGSMGISAGDYDGNGTLDIHISNYENQNASLFLGQQGTYRDRHVQFELDTSTYLMVGFGAQSIDYDNDGHLDLVVTNGHLDNTLENTASFKQPPQVLRNCGTRFQEITFDDPTKYLAGEYLGRGLSRLDFDQDGRTDFVVTHIGHPTALLVNQTESDHHWLQLRLIGTQSERDGVGAEVRLTLRSQEPRREMVEWVTAGDGYLSHNEDVVFFGVGDVTDIQSVTVSWPSGQKTVVENVHVDQRIMLIEGDSEPYTLFASDGKLQFPR